MCGFVYVNLNPACTFPRYFWSNFLSLRSIVFLFSAMVQGEPLNSALQIWSPEISNIPLSYGAKHILIP